jgi:hypothetical protein
MMNYSAAVVEQIPLIHVVDRDDELLLNCIDAEWYRILHHFVWQDYLEIAAEYYDALYHFNLLEAKKSRERRLNQAEACDESKEEAAQRLLFDRPTMNKACPVLYQEEFESAPFLTVRPSSLAPGIVPDRIGGRKPKCFFALFKSFLGTSLLGFSPEPEIVHLLLTSNLPFARVCGFVPKDDNSEYWNRHVPSLRKLQQFDMIMRDWGLWDRIKWDEVKRNIKEGVIEKEKELVGDTTHYHAYSGFETVTYEEGGKEQKKSQSKVTKRCNCEDWEHCPHPWVLADDGAGTIVKSKSKIIWGHKASVLGFPKQGVPIDAAAVADGATFDGKTLFPHVEKVFEHLPEIKPVIDRVLYDSACDDKALKEKFQEELNIELKTSLNPRRKKPVTENLPRGMKKVTPYGSLICAAGHEMDYKGIRYEAEKLIYQAPVNGNNISVCLNCEHKMECCPHADIGRTINLSFDCLPHIDTDDPPMAKRFKAIMTRRPSVERMIKRLKCDLGDDRLKKRGNASFQAYLDKTMIAFHVLLRN